MSILEDLADGLARDALSLERDEDDKLVDQIAIAIGATSQTLEEAYLTAIRVRRAERRARAMILERQSETDG
ncbi:MAG: hypothetical protein ACI9KS_000559 [Sulfitobacter sp.]|jgi:hypothetical protein